MKRMTFMTLAVLFGKLVHGTAFVLFYRAYEATLALPIYWALLAATISVGAFILAIVIPWRIIVRVSVGVVLFTAFFLVMFHLIVLVRDVLASPIEWWEFNLILETFPETVVFLFIPLIDFPFAVFLWYRSQWINRDVCPEASEWCKWVNK